MRNLFKKYQDQALIIVALFILAGTAWFFIWGIGILIGNFNKALNIGAAPHTPTEFNLKEAENLLQAKGTAQ
jgi:hypothetical protein